MHTNVNNAQSQKIQYKAQPTYTFQILPEAYISFPPHVSTQIAIIQLAKLFPSAISAQYEQNKQYYFGILQAIRLWEEQESMAIKTFTLHRARHARYRPCALF